MRYLLLTILLLAGSQTYIKAQTNGSVSGNFIVYSIQSITVTSLSGVISFSTPNDYFNGVVTNNYANIKVKSNTNWIVSFAAQSANFTPLSKSGSTDMPSGVMGIRINGHSNFKTLSTTSQQLRSGQKGSGTNKHDFNIDVSFNPGFGYNGGVYSMGIVYTLTKQ
ncbi:MAG: hypothetical protein H6550_08440 [Chitinophagales bacterium]|nr:hypothetical protein [Chitinophagales bacterium]